MEDKAYPSYREFFEDTYPTSETGCALMGHVFRGVSSDHYTLIPKSLREDHVSWLCAYTPGMEERLSGWRAGQAQIQIEADILMDFYWLADTRGLMLPNIGEYRKGLYAKNKETRYEHWIPDELLNLAALAQHYGVPTRLLDWTHDLYTAVYFAISNAMKEMIENKMREEQKIVIWTLDHTLLSTSLKYEYREEEQKLRFVNPPYFGNSNLSAQKGILTTWKEELSQYEFPINRSPLDELLTQQFGSNTPLYKMTFPAKNCVDVYQVLKALGYTASRLFPGFEGVSREIEDNRRFTALRHARLMTK